MFCKVTAFNLVENYRRFGGMYYINSDGQNISGESNQQDGRKKQGKIFPKCRQTSNQTTTHDVENYTLQMTTI
jgi:hypothetical protein